jgi:PAS domain S-box-containing protein
MDSIDRYEGEQLMVNNADVMKEGSNVIVFITIIGLFISFSLFLFVNDLAFEKQEITLAQVTERQLNSIQDKFDNAVKSINAISALFAASNQVTRKEFSIFASIRLIDSPNVLALEWIPKVKHSDRAIFESAAQKELVTNFTFTEDNLQGGMVAARERDVYYPVYFVEPLKGNETALGFDLSTHPQRLQAIQEARDTGIFVASGIVELVQSQQHGAGFLVVKAIYSNGLVPESLAEKRALLEGYSLGVLKLQDLFKTQTLLGDNESQSTIFVFENNAAVGQKIIYPVMSPYQTLEEVKKAQNGLCLLKPLLLANQEWALYQCISNNKMDYLGNIEALIVLFCSLILTFVTTRYLIVQQKQRMHANKLLLELRNSEFYLNEIFNNVDDAIVSTDMFGRISSVNYSLIKLFGYTEQELIGQSVELIVHNYTSKDQFVGFSIFSNIEQYQALGKKRVELRAKHKNSKEFPIEISIRQIKYHGRDIVIGMLKDLSMVEEREQAQLEISKNATELRQLIDTANAPIFGIDAAGLVNEWNQRAEQLTGFAKIDVMGKGLVAGFITDDYKASVKGILDKALQGEESANYEFPLFTKMGDRVDVLLNSTSRRDAAGHIMGVVGVGQDITELNKIRKEQESVAHDLTQLIDTANAPIFGIDAAGLVNEWNQRAEQLTGFAKIDVMGKDLVAGFITHDYKASVKEVLDKALQGEESANYEFPLYTKTGDRVDVLLNSTSRRDAAGHIMGVVGVGQDITELNKIRLEQESVAHDLTQLIDTANAPIFGIDAAGLVNEWNQCAEQLTGFAKVDVMGKDLVAGFITDDYKASVKEVLDKALQGKESANYEFPLYTKTGDRVDVLLNSTSRRDAYGQVIGVVGVGQDITKAKKSQAQVVQASKLATLGEMATSVAHELNQPLNVIRMAAGNSRRRIKNQESNKDTEYILEKLVRIEGQTSRAAAIIDHMRMFGRKAEEKSEMVDSREVVSNALDLLGAQLKLAGIKVVTNFPEKCSKVMGHTIQMEQVILNLLANARDAMKDNISGSRITLSITEKDEMITISSEDTGGGIPEHILSRIFEPFFTTKEMGKGTGLGLSVSYGIILEMGGTIIADNITDGAKFSITLPTTNNIFKE